MAKRKKVAPVVEKVEPYIEGVAKHLVDRLYGPDGPPWGTKMTELEDVILAVDQQQMQYAEYRRLGLPITSSYVESAVKQFNQRVKGTEKFWSERGAEAILQLRADHLSDHQPLDRFWQERQDRQTGQRPYGIAA